METITKKFEYIELLEAALSAGIKKTRLNEAIDSHSLDKAGQFTDEVTVIDGEMPHLRMTTTSGRICSVGRIRPTANFSQVEKLEELETIPGSREDTKEFAFLKTSLLNGHLPADQAKCAVALQGKYYRTTLRKGYVIPLKMGADKKPIFALNTSAGIKALKNSAVLKDFWEIEISETPFKD
jgi:hypothetical protein